MKKSIITFILLTIVAIGMYAQQKQISYIKPDGAWYHVYDESGKKVNTMSKQAVGKVVGWGTDFFVAVDGAWVKTYYVTGKKINTMSKQALGEVIGVSGNTFTTQDGDWIKVYDKTGKKISTRSAH